MSERPRQTPGSSADEGGSTRDSGGPVPRLPSRALRDRRVTAPSRDEHEQVEQRVAAQLRRRDGNGVAVRRPAASRREAPAAQVQEDVDGARLVEERRVGHAFAIEVRPGEPARARDGGERVARRERAVAVVAQDERLAVARREDEIEIAVGVDVGRPDAGGGGAHERRRQFRRGGDVGEAAGVVLPQQAHAAGAGERQIRPEVVVQICGGDARRASVAPLAGGRTRRRTAHIARRAGEVHARRPRGADHRVALAGRARPRRPTRRRDGASGTARS